VPIRVNKLLPISSEPEGLTVVQIVQNPGVCRQAHEFPKMGTSDPAAQIL
jgi:hypothetical protein